MRISNDLTEEQYVDIMKALQDCETEIKNNFANVMQPCKIDCPLGSEGHCGKTLKEYLFHCEKLNNENKEQRGNGLNKNLAMLL